MGRRRWASGARKVVVPGPTTAPRASGGKRSLDVALAAGAKAADERSAPRVPASVGVRRHCTRGRDGARATQQPRRQ
jgi:hypothetical protein